MTFGYFNFIDDIETQGIIIIELGLTYIRCSPFGLPLSWKWKDSTSSANLAGAGMFRACPAGMEVP